jgi:activator of HSP90 ATPase
MTSDLKFTVKFRVPPYIIYQALTDQSLMLKYMQCKLNYEPKVNFEYNLYENAIVGKVKEVIENKKILQSWKFSSWQNEAELRIIIKENKGNECELSIDLKGVPNRDIFNKTIELETVKNGFYQQIFDRISTFLGYPQNKDNQDDSDDE